MIILTRRTTAILNPPDANTAVLDLDQSGNPQVEMPSGEVLPLGVFTDTNGSGNKFKITVNNGALVLVPHA